MEILTNPHFCNVKYMRSRRKYTMDMDYKKSIICYAVTSFFWVICWTIVLAQNGVMGIGKGTVFFLIAVLVGIPCGVIGGIIGNIIRTAVHPDMIITSNGVWGLLFQKIFWKIGPQTIGILFGAAIPFMILSKLFGFAE